MQENSPKKITIPGSVKRIESLREDEKDIHDLLAAALAAAESGDADAQVILGCCYYYGGGVTQDYKEAVKWFKLAYANGHTEAKQYLDNMK